jgi:CRISPR/Cas system CMR subunit Cmr6 (Cas7 group RAMP superfamily)
MIEDIIKQTYPVTKKEKCCAMLKAKMEAKREALRNRLNDQQRENRMGKEISQNECEVWQTVLS